MQVAKKIMSITNIEEVIAKCLVEGGAMYYITEDDSVKLKITYKNIPVACVEIKHG